MDVLYPPGMTSIAAGDLPGPYLQNCREGAKAWEARNPNQLFSAVASRFCSAESIFFHSYSAISIANRLARFVKIQEGLLSQASQANSALYADLAKSLFARFYAKLIPRLGT